MFYATSFSAMYHVPLGGHPLTLGGVCPALAKLC
jgi:hypothetical protein